MKRITADYWTQENVVKIQIKTKMEQTDLQNMLPDCQCVSYGYVPKTMEDIYIFERVFSSESDLTEFVNSDMITKQIEMREVK